jgi:hypothetical protein
MLGAQYRGRKMPAVNRYYVLKRGAEFKTIFMDQASADLWVKAGWEIAPKSYESHYEALLAMERWQSGREPPRN